MQVEGSWRISEPQVQKVQSARASHRGREINHVERANVYERSGCMSVPLIWYAVHCKPQKEGLVQMLLKHQGIKTLFLHYITTIKHARRTRTVTRSLFARYLFAGVVDHNIVPEINRTIGVSTVVYCGDRPLEIPTEVIDELRARGDKNGLVRLTPAELGERRRFRRGQQVRIIDGPLAGFLAVVALDSGPNKCRVWLGMFGGKVDALVDPEGLEAVSPEWGDLRQNRR